jgi:hypothetical protein
VDPDSQHERICAFQVEREWLGLSTGQVPLLLFSEIRFQKSIKKS